MTDLRARLLVHQAELQREQVLALRSSEAQKIAQATIDLLAEAAAALAAPGVPAPAVDGTQAGAAIRTADRLPDDGQRVFIWLLSYLGGYWRESRFLNLRMPGPSFEGYYGPWPKWWMPQPADPEAARGEAPVLPAQEDQEKPR